MWTGVMTMIRVIARLANRHRANRQRHGGIPPELSWHCAQPGWRRASCSA
jgi:hypothetical protein